MGKFDGKTVVITGASAGIGLETALAFAREGADLIINSQTAAKCEAAAEAMRALGAKAETVSGDVSEETVAARLIETAVRVFGRIDILINCAGIVPAGDVTKPAPDEWDRGMRINVKSVYLTCSKAVPVMKEQGFGCIVNISSISADQGIKNRALYSATKGAVSSLTRAMAADFITDNIRVNCVCPGTIYTPSVQQRIENTPDPAAEKVSYESRQPMKRLGTPQEVAHAILYLCEDGASFVTGTSLHVDGGAQALL